MDALAYDRNVEGVACAYLLDRECHSRTGLSLHPVAAFLAFQPLCRLSVDSYDLVTALKAVFFSRRTCVRLVDDDVVFLLLVDDRSDASVCLGKHHLQVFVLLLRDVDCIRVELFEHGVDAGPHDPVDRE